MSSQQYLPSVVRSHIAHHVSNAGNRARLRAVDRGWRNSTSVSTNETRLGYLGSDLASLLRDGTRELARWLAAAPRHLTRWLVSYGYHRRADGWYCKTLATTPPRPDPVLGDISLSVTVSIYPGPPMGWILTFNQEKTSSRTGLTKQSVYAKAVSSPGGTADFSGFGSTDATFGPDLRAALAGLGIGEYDRRASLASINFGSLSLGPNN